MQAVNFENMSKDELLVALSASIAAEQEYSVLLNESSDPIFAFYPDGTYRYVNQVFARGVGKPIDQIIGNKIWDVFSKDEADRRFAVVRSVFDSGDIREIEVRVPTPSGDHYYLTTVKPILDTQCHVVSVMCISKDITERKSIQHELEARRDQAIALIDEKIRAENAVRQLNESLEKRVLSRTRDLEDANRKLVDSESMLRRLLQEKEVLIMEIHHRVKNNLQVIASLLRLESGRNTHTETQSVLQTMQGWIRSMALLHETIYRAGTYAVVDLGRYLEQIATQTFRALLGSRDSIHLRLRMGTVHVGIDQATPCGLLVTELLSNAIKHGFTGECRGEIVVVLEQVHDEDVWRISVSDTGVGLPADFELRRQESLGMQLVSALVTQVGGSLQIGPGAAFAVAFKVVQPTPTLGHSLNSDNHRNESA
jgi:PAS domain S-box-containing protein